ncbi:MAG: PBP1A family penicillin-binding protein [Myxococcota bacterium]|nr:PBP1A family penicillin-binding protein [Myxococcota bacterium]
MRRRDPSVPPAGTREPASSKRNNFFALGAARAAAVAARMGRGMRRWLPLVSLVAAALAITTGVTLGLIVHHYESGLPRVTELKTYQPPQVTRILGRDGVVLAELYSQRRTVISIQSLPPHVKLAVLGAEDAGFYEHEGLNYLGIARAMLVNLRARSTRQGGSTITQQVVKNLLLATRERTFARKIREALLARRLEQELSKDEILELYLNNIYFGRGRYGIEEAARDDFGKSAKDMTLAEAALVAGRIANPHEFHPRTSLTAALARRAYVLDQMHAKGFLEAAPCAAAKNEPVTLAALAEPSSDLAPEAVEIAKTVLYRIDPEQARLGGFTVTTSIDSKLQAAARKAVRDALSSYDKRHGLQGVLRLQTMTADKKGKAALPREAVFDGTPRFEQHRVLTGIVLATDDDAGAFDVRVGSITGTVKLADFERYNVGKLAPSAFAPLGAHVRVSLLAPISLTPGAPEDASPLAKTPLRLESGPEGALVAIDMRTRQILALVGSYEGQAGALDRATHSRRQPGSTFKPIVYSYAIHSRRFTPATLVDPNPEIFEGGYHPSNFEGWTGNDRLRLREALANSVNVAAVRVLRDVGPANVVSWARALGIDSPMKPDLSLALGSYEVRPLELAGAYATFGGGGVYDEPQLVLRIVGPDGKDVALPERPPARRVLADDEAYVVTSMLTSVIDHGTGARARSLGRPLAGKTGTSNGPKDAWFAGYSTDLAAVVWVGYDDGKTLGAAEQGAVTALPAWIAFMKVATEGTPRVDFPRPPGVATVSIDRRTGALPYPDDADVLDEVFLTGSEPTAVAEPPPPERVNESGTAGGAPPR